MKNESITLPSSTKITYSFFFILSSIAVVLNALWMLSNIYNRSIKLDFEQWTLAGEVPSVEDWQVTFSKINTSINLDSKNPETIQLEGMLYEWKNFIYAENINTNDQINNRQRAIESYRSASTLKPASPDSWAQIARQKAATQQFDTEFLVALNKAIKLGPMETDIQIIITEIANIAWPFLKTQIPLADTILRSVSNGLNSNRANIHLQKLTNTDLLTILCQPTRLETTNLAVINTCQNIKLP